LPTKHSQNSAPVAHARNGSHPTSFLLMPALFASALAAASCSESTKSADTSPSSEAVLVMDTLTVIGGVEADGPSALGAVAGGAILRDPSRFAVADRMAGSIRVFDQNGAHVMSFGRSGNGPGEFGTLSSVWSTASGGVGAWDSRGRIVSIWNEVGEFQTSSRLTLDSPLTEPSFVGELSEGAWLFRIQPHAMSRGGTPEGTIQDTLRFAVLDSEQSEPRGLHEASGPERFLFARPHHLGVENHIFGAEALAGVVDGMLITGRSDASHLELINPNGEVSGNLPINVSSRPLRESDIATERERRIESLSIPGVRDAEGRDVTDVIRASRESIIRNLPAGMEGPRIDRLVTNAEDGYWVRRFVIPGDSDAIWIRSDRSGQVTGTLTLPIRSEVLAARGDRILVMDRGELDVIILVLAAVRARASLN